MRESIRERIIDRLGQTAATVDGLKGGVWRSRKEALSREDCPVILLEPGSDPADYTDYTFMNWKLQLRFTIITRGAEPDRLADPIVSDLYRKLMSDRNVGGLAIDLNPAGIDFTVAEGDLAVGLTTCSFLVDYRTLQEDICR